MPIVGMTPEEVLVATAKQVATGAKSTDRASKLPGETSAEANARITAGYKDMTAKPILTPEMEEANYQVKFVRKGAGGVGIYEAVAPIFAPKVEDNKTTQWTMGIIPTIGGKLTGTTLGAWSNGDGTVTNISDIPFTTISSMGADPVRATTTLDGKPASMPTSTATPAAVKSTTKRYTTAELQGIISKFTRGAALTDEEKSVIGIGTTPAATPSFSPPPPATDSATAKKYTTAELQTIVAKLGTGGTLTDDEKAAIGMGSTTANQNIAPDDQYYTVKVGTTGKTQAQLDAVPGQNAALQLNKDIATLLGGTVGPDGKVTNVAGKTVTSIVPNADGTTTITASDGTKTVVKTPKTAATGKKEISRVDNGDGTFTVTYEDKSTEIVGTKRVTPDILTNKPIGTPPAFVYDPVTKKWVMPDKPEEEGNWVWDNVKGWTDTNVKPGSTGMETGSTRTLAQDTFKNTLALFFGASEMAQPWANALFKVVSGYYKSGSTIDESLNLALQEARNNPVLEPFTKRFAGVYALQDRRAQGEALDVPTIAEFFKSQVTLGDRLREVGLGDLASNEILGEVLGTGKSVSAVLNLVNDVFMTIDNAPEALKKDLQVVAPGIDRTSIAKALLLGQRGAEALQKQIKEVSVLSAAKSQGVSLENTLAADIAARGFDYNTSLTNFGTVAKGAVPFQKLTEISTGAAVKPVDSQQTLIKSLFQQDVKAQEQIRLEAEKEAARFSGSSGTFGSRSLASRNRANRVI